MGHDHSHVHALRRERWRSRLGVALVITCASFVVEIAGAVVSGSLALAADAAHLFTDVGTLVLAYAAMRLADQAPTGRYSFGFYRAEILAAFVNAQLLLLVTAYVFWEAYRRFAAPPEVDTMVMTAVAVAGLGANLVSMALLHAERNETLNLRAAYLEVASDALGSIGVVIAGVAMRRTSWFWLDPAASIAIGLLILPRTISLLRQSGHILLEGAPHELDLPAVRALLLNIPGVVELHDLHCWTLTSGIHSATVHIRAADDSPRGEVLRAVQQALKDAAGIEHSTIQVEWGTDAGCDTTDHA